jgi:adenylylsulfate reductase subunit B
MEDPGPDLGGARWADSGKREDMNLSIDKDCCSGCGTCVQLCPGHVLAMDERGLPTERYPDSCWYCGVCEVECPEGCIRVIFPYLIR